MKYSGSLDNTITEREERNYNLAYEIAIESMVLLENDGLLPLKDKNIALYGIGARNTCFGGSGSGEVNTRFKISIYEGLKNSGFNILTEDYLDKLDLVLEEEKNKWIKSFKKNIKKVKFSDYVDYAGKNIFKLDKFVDIKTKKDCDTAIYVIRREAGEGGDREYILGDIYLSEAEKNDLNILRKMYPKLIIILNTPGIVEDITNFKCNVLVYTALSGMMLGKALASLLSGKHSFSGHLSTTWAKNFPISYDNTKIDNYTDSIYVGYRYFSSFNKPVIYPFGYGLSYSKFSYTFKNININNNLIDITFNIKNIGNYKAKEVLSLYLTTPNPNREKYILVAFNKTKELDIAESEDITLSFDLFDFCLFKDNKYLLDKGKYLISYGSNVSNLMPLCYLNLLDTFIYKEVRNITSKEIDVISTKVKLPKLDVNSYDIVLNKEEDKIISNNKLGSYYLEKLSIKEKISLLVGTSYIGKPYFKTFGVAGYTTSKLVKKGLANLVLADGPQGLNLKPMSRKPIFKFFNAPPLPKTFDYTIIGKILNLRKIKPSSKQKIYYQYTTNFPSANALSQTFNLDLAYKEGLAIKEEMLEYGVDFLLAPGVNIIRDPRGGRNYEYFSEDPYLTALFGISLACAIESDKTHVTLKHFACNNRENYRKEISSNLDERTLREIYLKVYELIIKKSKVKAIMTSYNKVNDTYATTSYELVTKVLREEFGFRGIIMTDWFASGHDEARDELVIKAGVNLIMPGLPNINKKLYKAYKNKIIRLEEIDNLVSDLIDVILRSNKDF